MSLLYLPRNSTQYNIARTTTFRLGSRMLTLRFTSPAREGKCGSNLQNQERTVKRIYLSDGWNYEDEEEKQKLAHYLSNRDLSIFTEEQLARIKILVKVDQAGAEALIVAYLTRHGNFRDLFLNGIKSHVYVGLHVFADVWKKELQNSGSDIKCDIDLLCSLPINQITQYPFWKTVDKLIKDSDHWPNERRYYHIAKQICHSSNYDIEAGMFQLNTLEKSKGRIVLPLPECQRYLNLYHGLFPEIHEWHRGVERQLTETKILYNLFGFPREFWFTTKHPDKTLVKEALAFVPQSTVGSITNIAYTELQTEIEDRHLNWDLLSNEHDSYMLQCPIGQEIEAGSRMQDIINMPFKSPVDGVAFNMKSECKVGFNWSDHGKTNPLGLN